MDDDIKDTSISSVKLHDSVGARGGTEANGHQPNLGTKPASSMASSSNCRSSNIYLFRHVGKLLEGRRFY